jgi:hypothetical protein
VLLKKWRARDRQMFDDHDGEGKIKRFLNTPRPVRVWYNAAVSSDDGMPLTSDSLPLSGTSLTVNQYPSNTVRTGTRLQRGAVQNLSSVIVIVDTNRLTSLSVGQLADYIAMVGLAEVHLDADAGSTPTILHLFDMTGEASPQGLNDWDQALLKSLYTTDQKSVMQLSQIETRMLQSVAP